MSKTFFRRHLQLFCHVYYVPTEDANFIRYEALGNVLYNVFNAEVNHANRIQDNSRDLVLGDLFEGTKLYIFTGRT